jgi:hypothetical protein
MIFPLDSGTSELVLSHFIWKMGCRTRCCVHGASPGAENQLVLRFPAASGTFFNACLAFCFLHLLGNTLQVLCDLFGVVILRMNGLHTPLQQFVRIHKSKNLRRNASPFVAASFSSMSTPSLKMLPFCLLTPNSTPLSVVRVL